MLNVYLCHDHIYVSANCFLYASLDGKPIRYGYMDEAHHVFDGMYKREESAFAWNSFENYAVSLVHVWIETGMVTEGSTAQPKKSNPGPRFATVVGAKDLTEVKMGSG